jgi:hypothetical protein
LGTSSGYSGRFQKAKILWQSIKEKGEGNVVLVRYQRIFVLLGSTGTHETFSKLARRDIRTHPIHFGGYSIGVRGGSPWVQITPHRYRKLQQLFYAISLHNEAKVSDFLVRAFYLNFPGVRAQRKQVLKVINERRKRAGLSEVTRPVSRRFPRYASRGSI